MFTDNFIELFKDAIDFLLGSTGRLLATLLAGHGFRHFTDGLSSLSSGTSHSRLILSIYLAIGLNAQLSQNRLLGFIEALRETSLYGIYTIALIVNIVLSEDRLDIGFTLVNTRTDSFAQFRVLEPLDELLHHGTIEDLGHIALLRVKGLGHSLIGTGNGLGSLSLRIILSRCRILYGG